MGTADFGLIVISDMSLGECIYRLLTNILSFGIISFISRTVSLLSSDSTIYKGVAAEFMRTFRDENGGGDVSI